MPLYGPHGHGGREGSVVYIHVRISHQQRTSHRRTTTYQHLSEEITIVADAHPLIAEVLQVCT